MSQEASIRATRAQQLLDDEVLQEALAEIQADAKFKALNTDLSNQSQCVEAIAQIQAAETMLTILRAYITAGKAEQRKPFKAA
jgi:hypothetical protein